MAKKAEPKKTIKIACKGAGTLSIDLLTPLQGAFKILTLENHDRLKKEILDDGFIEPVAVWEDPSSSTVYVLNGHQRCEVLRNLRDDEGYQIPQIPVSYVEATSLKDAKRKILALASQYGSVSSQGLKGLLEELDLSVDSMGEMFNFPEIDVAAIISGLGHDIVLGSDVEANFTLNNTNLHELKKLKGHLEELDETIDEVPEPPKKPKTKPGQIWKLGDHRLMCGDSTSREQVDRLMSGEKADLVFTDPPYGVNYDGGHANENRREKLANDHDTEIYGRSVPLMFEFSKKNAALYLWFAATKSLQVLQVLQVCDYQIRNWIIWNKNMAQFGAIGAQYKQKHEPCLYAFKKGQTPFWDGPTNEVSVWDENRASKNEYHPTQKPVELSRRAITNSCPENGLVLDLFGGSGATLIASEVSGRHCYMMELAPEYCDVIVARWEKHTGNKAELEEARPKTIRRSSLASASAD